MDLAIKVKASDMNDKSGTVNSKVELAYASLIEHYGDDLARELITGGLRRIARKLNKRLRGWTASELADAYVDAREGVIPKLKDLR